MQKALRASYRAFFERLGRCFSPWVVETYPFKGGSSAASD
jgi:hypothetical protein